MATTGKGDNKMSVPAEKMNIIPMVASDNMAMLEMIERLVVNPDVDAGKMQQILDMKTSIFDKGAEIEFNRSMSIVQSEMKPIVKDGENEHTKSMFAKLESICEKITPIYTAHGFALSFYEEDCPKADHVRVMCEITHSGFSKIRHLDVPNDIMGTGGNRTKTNTQGFGSTTSYGRRYLTTMIFNLTIKDMDNDGNSTKTPHKTISRTEVAFIKAELRKAKLSQTYICEKAGVNKIEEIAKGRYQGCIKHIQGKGVQK